MDMLPDTAKPMGAIQRACFLLFLLQAAVLTSADDSSIAASSDRNFPVNVKLVNWPGDSDFNNYVTELAVQVCKLCYMQFLASVWNIN